MATNNIKIFDENKGNIMSTQEYSTNAQRLNGVQQGIASSMLQNKTLYQLSLVAYAIGQMMVNNGLDANDENAVSAFVGNLANTIVQKVVDKASTAEAQAGTDANKFMTPATTRAAINVLKATSGMATAGTDTTHWMTPALVKQVVDSGFSKIVSPNLRAYITTYNGDGSDSKTIIFPSPPKIIFIIGTYNGDVGQYYGYVISGMSTMIYDDHNAQRLSCSFSGNNFIMNDNGFNFENYLYYVFAICDS